MAKSIFKKVKHVSKTTTHFFQKTLQNSRGDQVKFLLSFFFLKKWVVFMKKLRESHFDEKNDLFSLLHFQKSTTKILDPKNGPEFTRWPSQNFLGNTKVTQIVTKVTQKSIFLKTQINSRGAQLDMKKIKFWICKSH